MELLPVLLLMQPATSFALVQTNLGLGVGLVANSESPGRRHRHLVRFATEVKNEAESVLNQATTPTPLYYGDTFNPLGQVGRLPCSLQ